MQIFNKKSLIKYTLVSLILGISVTLFTRNADSLTNIINILFISGLFALIFGLVSFILKVGLFDIFLYSFGLLRMYSKHFQDDLKDEKPRSYLQYKEEKNKHSTAKEPFIISCLFILLSIILTILTYF